METETKKRVLNTLKSIRIILESGKVVPFELKKLSNSLAEDISLFHDQDSISIAVLTYSIYKIFNKNKDLEKRQLICLIKTAEKTIDIEPQFRNSIRLLFDQIKKYDNNIDTNMIKIIKHAQIKRGLKVYEHGISIGGASEIMGISRWNLMDYVGNYDIIDKDSNMRIDQKARLEFTRGLFK
jgi:hypothetical protein